MSEDIKVYVVDYGQSRNLMMRYTDPVTGKHIARSAGTRNGRDADRAAAKWEAELRSGRYKPASKAMWAEFRQRFEDEKAAEPVGELRRRNERDVQSLREVGRSVDIENQRRDDQSV